MLRAASSRCAIVALALPDAHCTLRLINLRCNTSPPACNSQTDVEADWSAVLSLLIATPSVGSVFTPPLLSALTTV
jgi:hypothetical protein